MYKVSTSLFCKASSSRMTQVTLLDEAANQKPSRPCTVCETQAPKLTTKGYLMVLYLRSLLGSIPNPGTVNTQRIYNTIMYTQLLDSQNHG